MPDYVSNVTIDQAAEILRRHNNIMVTTHAKPDGDAFGAVVALTAALRLMGARVEGCFMPPLPANFRTLRGYELTRVCATGSEFPSADLTVILDTGAWSQLAPGREALTTRLANTLILDHHLSGDVAAAWRLIDGGAAASCELVAQVIDLLGQTAGRAQSKSRERDALYDPTVAEALFVGIAADTGWFRFSNTRAQTHDLAARLLRMGVNQSELHQKLEQTERPEKLNLLIRALASLKLLAGGQAAIMVLRAEDFAQSGALIEETERFVDIPQQVSSIRLVVLVTETPSTRAAGAPAPGLGPIRLSFRSKAGPEAVNVAQLANQFGGGGHARAAGAKVDGPLEQVVERVGAAVVEVLKSE